MEELGFAWVAAEGVDAQQPCAEFSYVHPENVETSWTYHDCSIAQQIEVVHAREKISLN